MKIHVLIFLLLSLQINNYSILPPLNIYRYTHMTPTSSLLRETTR